MNSSLTAFQFDSNVAHGAFVELSAGVPQMLGHRDYSADVQRLIGEAMAAMPLLATHLRFEGRINLQFQGNGAIKLLVAQIDHLLQVRGMAKAPPGLTGSFASLLEGGVLALMLEPSDAAASGGRQPTQALVPIEGECLSQALEGYFQQSEQLPTVLRLAAAEGRLCGFMLQRLPIRDSRAAEDDWERLSLLASTLSAPELLSADAATLLPRLFGDEPLHVFAPRPVTIDCRCSRAGIARLLLSLGRDEADSILAEQGRVSVTCEFCGREHVFSAGDVVGLFIAAGGTPSSTRH